MGMARPALQIKVKPSDRRKLKDLLDGGIQQVRVTLRAVALLQLSGGASAPRISEVLPQTPQATRKIGHRYEQGGFDCAIYEKARPGPAEVLDDTQKQRIIAMVCSDPPDGYARWPISTTRTSSAWRTCWKPMKNRSIRKNQWSAWTRSRSPYTPRCARHLRPCRGGKARRDSEYERCGTANVFCAVEPKAGRHFTFPTPTRSGFEFAQVVAELAFQYPEAETIHLVMDNLSSHTCKSLTDLYGGELGSQIWDRFTVHYTPTHGSWLNQAEIEIGIFAKQCLGKRRIPNLKVLRRQARAWNRRVNRARTKINWKFDRKAARRKFGYKKKLSKRSKT